MGSLVKPGKLFINNEWCEAQSGKRFDVFNPATEEKLTDVAEGDAADINAACLSARRAFEGGEWKQMSARDRGRLLSRFAQLLDKNKEELAELETLNNGKPINETLNADLPLAVDCFDYYAGLAHKIHGDTIPVNGNFFNYTLNEKNIFINI